MGADVTDLLSALLLDWPWAAMVALLMITVWAQRKLMAALDEESRQLVQDARRLVHEVERQRNLITRAAPFIELLAGAFSHAQGSPGAEATREVTDKQAAAALDLHIELGKWKTGK